MTLVTGYHSSDHPVMEPRALLHVGTLEQARMRGGRHIHEIMFQAQRARRLRDDGSLGDRNIRRLIRGRNRLVVYLNRYEGISQDAYDRVKTEHGISIADLDGMDDGRFRLHIPEARDSWIIIDPKIIEKVRPLERTEKP